MGYLMKIYLDTSAPKFSSDPGPDSLTDVVIGNYIENRINNDSIIDVLLVGSKDELLAWADEFKEFVKNRNE
jgi:hypothetical protein